MHQPERYENESFAAYRERRAAAKHAAKRIAGHGLNGGISARQQFRDDMRKSGTMGKRTRAYVALMAAWASKRVTRAKLRDEHGAYTVIGPVYEVDGANPTEREHVISRWKAPDDMGYTARRKWLGGISAQRGY